jgi:lipopolysaccharide transport system permease protein
MTILNYLFSPNKIMQNWWMHRELIKEFSKREILIRYKGSALGLMWSFFNPLFMLSIYTFVFSEIFKARWNEISQTKTEFALLLFIGLLVFNLISECLIRAPTVITTNINYVKKVIFPLDILPITVMIAALFHGLISLFIWIIAYSIFIGVPQSTLIYLPLVITPYILFILGISWFLASLGVFLRDVSQFIGMMLNVLLFISPIFYPITAIPEKYRFIFQLNPLTLVIDQARLVMYWGSRPDFLSISLLFLFSIVIYYLGFVWFQNTRKGFSDVL